MTASHHDVSKPTAEMQAKGKAFLDELNDIRRAAGERPLTLEDLIFLSNYKVRASYAIGYIY
jgi:hypothetical protein